MMINTTLEIPKRLIKRPQNHGYLSQLERCLLQIISYTMPIALFCLRLHAGQVTIIIYNRQYFELSLANRHVMSNNLCVLSLKVSVSDTYTGLAGPGMLKWFVFILSSLILSLLKSLTVLVHFLLLVNSTRSGFKVTLVELILYTSLICSSCRIILTVLDSDFLKSHNSSLDSGLFVSFKVLVKYYVYYTYPLDPYTSFSCQVLQAFLQAYIYVYSSFPALFHLSSRYCIFTSTASYLTDIN